MSELPTIWVKLSDGGTNHEISCREPSEAENFTAENFAEMMKGVNGGFIEADDGWWINVNQIVAIRDAP